MAYINIPVKNNTTPLTPTEWNYLVDKVNLRRLRDIIDVQDSDPHDKDMLRHDGSGWTYWDIYSEFYTKDEINSLIVESGGGSTWGTITGNILTQTDLVDLINASSGVQDITPPDWGIGVLSLDIDKAEWGEIYGNISLQTDLTQLISSQINGLSLQDVTENGFITSYHLRAGNWQKQTTLIGGGLPASGVIMEEAGSTADMIFNVLTGKIEFNRLLTSSGGVFNPSLDTDYVQKKYVDDAVIGGIVYKGEHTPVAGTEYPTATPVQGWLYDIVGLNTAGYILTTGNLSGTVVYNGDELIYDGTNWVLRKLQVPLQNYVIPHKVPYVFKSGLNVDNNILEAGDFCRIFIDGSLIDGVYLGGSEQDRLSYDIYNEFKTDQAAAVPPVVGTLSITDVLETSARLHCTATDALGIVQWDVMVNGALYQSVSDTGTLDEVITGLAEDTDYNIYVKPYNPLDYTVDSNTVAIKTGITVPDWSSGLIMDGLFTIEVSGIGTVDWGDGSALEAYDGTEISLNHTYTNFDGQIDFYGTLTSIHTVTSGSNLHHDIGLLPAGLDHYYNTGNNEVYGDIANLPLTIEGFYILGNNIIHGDIANLPNVQALYIDGQNIVSGDICSFPSSVVYIYLRGLNTITGDISCLNNGMAHCILEGLNTISDYTQGHVFNFEQRSFSHIPAAGSGLDSTEVDNLLIDMDNSVTTWLSGWWESELKLTGGNAPRTTASDAAVASLESKGASVITNGRAWTIGVQMNGDLPITVSGTGTIYWGDGTNDNYSGTEVLRTHDYVNFDGDITIVGSLTKFQCTRYTAPEPNFSFDLKTLPSEMKTLIMYSDNTATGDCIDMPKGMLVFDLEGQNVMGGDVKDLPLSLHHLEVTGANVITGDVADIPSSVSYLNMFGANTLYGALSSFSPNVTRLAIYGQNIISGNIADLPANLYYYNLIGLNTIDEYTSGHTFVSTISYFRSTSAAGSGLDATEIDNIFIDLEASGMSSGVINLGGVNAAPTAASSAARTSLAGQGVTITTN